MLARIRSIAIIVVVTILIWLLAEAESLRASEVRVRIAFWADPESGRLVRIEPGQDFNGTARVKLEGSTSQVDSLVQALLKEIRLEPGSEGVPAEPSPHATVQLQRALAALPVVRNSGVSIVEVDPPTVVISVDDIVTRECSVRVELPAAQIVEGAPEVNPPSVKVRLPASATVPPDLQLLARLEVRDLVNLPEGRRTTLTGIPVELPDPLRNLDPSLVRLSPREVSVSLTLRSRTSAAVVPSAVPVHIRLAPTELGLWDIQVPPESRLLTDVSVSGPADLIDQVRTEKLKPVAYVTLSFEDLERAAAAPNGAIEKEVLFSDFPSTLKFEPKQKTIRLTVKRRSGSPP